MPFACRWFDLDENSSGKLGGALAEDAAVIRGAVGDVFGVVAQNLSVMAGRYSRQAAVGAGYSTCVCLCMDVFVLWLIPQC